MIRAPWTKEQVDNLNRYQHCGLFHPYTCRNREPLSHGKNAIDLGELIPTTRGWICQYCDYTQDWADESLLAFDAEQERLAKEAFMLNG